MYLDADPKKIQDENCGYEVKSTFLYRLVYVVFILETWEENVTVEYSFHHIYPSEIYPTRVCFHTGPLTLSVFGIYRACP